MEYQDLKSGIRNHLNDAAEDFFMVGYFLRQISENALFTEDGYKSIWDFAKGEYGLSTSSASRFMAINARFSIDGGEHMAEKYIGMGVSKLQEMLGLPDEELEKVTQETTVREIRAMKKKQEEPKSFFGLPKTVRPEGSLLTTPGCGDGKYDCFSCARPCGIRQEERYCRTATLGNPFPCTQMSEEKRLDIEAGLFSKECQFLNIENAETREGDHEPTPCCQNCHYRRHEPPGSRRAAFYTHGRGNPHRKPRSHDRAYHSPTKGARFRMERKRGIHSGTDGNGGGGGRGHRRKSPCYSGYLQPDKIRKIPGHRKGRHFPA